jgi:hypothetical protein
MKIEFTRAEVEAILLDYAKLLTGQMFNTVEPGAYRTMPDSLIVSLKEEKDAAQ